MRATFRPLVWVGPTTRPSERRSRATFKAGWSATLDLLDRELWHLHARDLVIEADFREQDIRLDGMPRANARQPEHAGVRIAFRSSHGPLIYATDVCEFWQHNVRSIALGLEALRAVDRYGITKRAEQYQGWRAIESGSGTTSGGMTASAAIDRLEQISSTSRLGRTSSELVRRARALAHPDRNDGDRTLWDEVERLTAVLEVGR